MSRRRPFGRLSAEEAELWQKIVEQTAPMHPKRVNHPAPTLQAPPKQRHRDPIAPFSISGKEKEPRIKTDTAPPLSQRFAQQPLAMDQKAFTRMRRGKLPVEGRIDLHGMTLDQAHPTLVNFVLGAHAMGKRLVLVITGKGRTRRARDDWHDGHGVLKRQVPQWLNMPPLAQAVLQISEAHQNHGGSGAYYVYLRRNR